MARIRLATLLLAFLLGCGSPERQEPEFRTWNGLFLTLLPVDRESAIGKPFRVRLDLTNPGPRTLYYDDQNVDFASFELEGPGGSRALQIAGHGQTFGILKPIGPGESVTLLDNYDLATEYLIEQAGPWRARFCSYLHLAKQQNAGGESIVMTSDWIEVTLHEGKPQPWMEVARRLYDAKPPKWDLDAGGSAAGIHATFRSPTYIHAPPFKLVQVRIGTNASLKDPVALGSTRWGDAFYQAEWPDLDREWPDFRTAVLAALHRP